MPTPSMRHAAPATLLAVCGLSAAQGALPDHHSEHQHVQPYLIAQADILKSVTVEAKEIPAYLPHSLPSVSGPMPLSLRETPQSVSVITEERMRDQGLVSAADALARTTGITFGYHSSQEGIHASARGYRLDNVMVDGLSLSGGQRKLPGDLALYEQVEVMRGPAGLFAGSGTSGNPSGALNLVRKRPTKERRANALLSAGSWSNYRSTLDASGALNASGSLRARGIVSYVDQEFFHDFAYRKNLTIGTSMELDLTPATLLTFGLDYEARDARPAFARYFRAWDGSDLGGRRKSSSAMPWGKAEWSEYGAFVQLEHQFSNQWKLKTHYTRKQSDEFNDYASIAYNIDSRTGKYRNYIESNFGKGKFTDEGLSIDLNGNFDLWGRTHDFVTGFNMQHNRYRTLNLPASRRGYGRNGAPSKLEEVDFQNMDYSRYPWLPSSPDWSRWDIYEPDRQSGYYANMRLHVLDPLKIMLGARVNYFSEGGISKYYTATPEYKQGAFKQNGKVTPFAALSYDIAAQHTLHASYSEVFKFQDLYDMQGKRVDPLTGKNWELGLKSDWNGGQLQTMLSLYRLERTNGTWVVEQNPCQPLLAIRGISAACYVADDKQRTTGVEFEINGRLAPAWDIAVGISAMQRKYVKDTTVGGIPSESEGQSWTNTEPTRTAHVWLLHRLQGAAQGWRVGLGMRAQNRVWQDFAGQVTKDSKGNILSERPAFHMEQGSYAVFNAMLSWDINPQWRAQLNVDNLTSRQYQTQFGSWYISNSAPRSWLLSVTGRF